MKKQFFFIVIPVLITTSCGQSNKQTEISQPGSPNLSFHSDDSLKFLADKREKEIHDSEIVAEKGPLYPAELNLSKSLFFLPDNFSADSIISKIYRFTKFTNGKLAGIDSVTNEDKSAWGTDAIEMNYITSYQYKENGIQKYFLLLQGEANHYFNHTELRKEYFWFNSENKIWHLAKHYDECDFDGTDVTIFKLNDGSVIMEENGYSENHVFEEQLVFELIANDTILTVYHNSISKSNTEQSECISPAAGTACDCFSINGTASIDHQKGKSYFIVTENFNVEQFVSDTCADAGSLKSIVTKACRNGNSVIIKEEDQQKDSTMKITVLKSEKTFLKELSRLEKVNNKSAR